MPTLGQSKLFQELTERRVWFKQHYDSLNSLYISEKGIVKIESNNSLLVLDSINYSYYKSLFSHNENVKTKIDFVLKGKDTLLVFYIFYAERLFRIDIISNKKECSNNIIKYLEENTKWFHHHYGGLDGIYTDRVNYRSSRIDSEYNKINGRLHLIFTYKPSLKYLPFYCGTEKDENIHKKLIRRLNRR